MNRLNKYAEHFIKLEFIKFNIEIFQNESGRIGADFIIKTSKGNYYELLLKSFNIEKGSNITITKEELPAPKDNLYIAMVMITKNMECSLYLIPSIILLKPKEYSFINYKPKETCWNINVLLETIPEITKFSSANSISKL